MRRLSQNLERKGGKREREERINWGIREVLISNFKREILRSYEYIGVWSNFILYVERKIYIYCLLVSTSPSNCVNSSTPKTLSWSNFTQSGQSLCHHIIYHILPPLEMGGSVKITSPRVGLSTYSSSTPRTLRTKQTENIIMETNELILALNHSFLPAEINECHPQYYRDGLTLNHSEMANMYQQSGPEWNRSWVVWCDWCIYTSVTPHFKLTSSARTRLVSSRPESLTFPCSITCHENKLCNRKSPGFWKE